MIPPTIKPHNPVDPGNQFDTQELLTIHLTVEHTLRLMHKKPEEELRETEMMMENIGAFDVDPKDKRGLLMVCGLQVILTKCKGQLFELNPEYG